MNIDNKKYQLPSNNYIPIVSTKKQIVIGNTFNKDMLHYTGWLHRYNGNYKKTAHFTITKDGKIYNHFDSKYFSHFFKDNKLNEKSIIILLENEGYLIKKNKKLEFINWVGSIYNESDKIFEKKWRGYNYWDSYSEKQMESLSELVLMLCERFNLPVTIVNHNTKIEQINNISIFYRSNIKKYFTDLNPSWDCEFFKNKIEINEK
jgi:N-acetyl-anhydromuramyl-L-alanine amidase AmpD